MLVKANGEAAALTVDHSPESKKEAARIRRVGRLKVKKKLN